MDLSSVSASSLSKSNTPSYPVLHTYAFITVYSLQVLMNGAMPELLAIIWKCGPWFRIDPELYLVFLKSNNTLSGAVHGYPAQSFKVDHFYGGV